MLIISYDISDDKLRQRFSKMLEKNGAVRLQFSVYEVNHTSRHMNNLRLLIHHDYVPKFDSTDSVLIITVPNNHVEKFGYAVHWDEDVTFL